jgi:hypothetical protein
MSISYDPKLISSCHEKAQKAGPEEGDVINRGNSAHRSWLWSSIEAAM